MDTALDSAQTAMVRLRVIAEGKRVLSVGDDMGSTVLELAQVARMLWQVPFCAPLGSERNKRRARYFLKSVSDLVDAGRMVQIDGPPRLVLCNLHESAFEVAFLHGYTTGPDMLQYLEWVKYLASTIVVHDPGNEPARDAVIVWAADQGVPIERIGLLAILWEPATTEHEMGGWQ